MLKFFRKIRKKLLTENKFSKYLIYAIGEIVLIVVGLFIAIQLNNLNENNNTYKKQIKHLKAIKAEMINNLTAIHDKKTLSYNIMDAERKVINYIDKGFATEDEMSEQLRVITFNELIVPFENGALNEIISSGALKDIENDSIRNILASWEGKKTSLKSQEKQLADVRAMIINFYSEKGSIRILNDQRRLDMLKIGGTKRALSNLPLLKLRQFENAILHHMMLTNYLDFALYPELENEINNLIKLIDIEISKSKKQ